MPAVLLALLIKAAEDGTLVEIVETAVKLIQLLLPLIENPKTRATLVTAIEKIEAAGVRPAQPEDSAMQHAAGHTGMGGR